MIQYLFNLIVDIKIQTCYNKDKLKTRTTKGVGHKGLIKMRITLTNNFHNTSVVFNAKEVACSGSKILKLSSSQVKKSQKTLCGCNGCKCSNELGVNGHQEYENIEISKVGEATMTSKL
jgi:hypothetical protein